MKLPWIGQQVSVHFLDISLVPVFFAGWCVDTRSSSFTLTDGYSSRQFLVTSPLLLSCSLIASSSYNEYFNRKFLLNYSKYKAHTALLLSQTSLLSQK